MANGTRGRRLARAGVPAVRGMDGYACSTKCHPSHGTQTLPKEIR